MFTTTTIYALTASSLIASTLALPAGLKWAPTPATVSVAATPTFTNAPQFWKREDGQDWCSTQGVSYPCHYGAAGVPDFATNEVYPIHTRDAEVEIASTFWKREDGEDYCISQGVTYPCSYGTPPDFSAVASEDLETRDAEAEAAPYDDMEGFIAADDASSTPTSPSIEARGIEGLVSYGSAQWMAAQPMIIKNSNCKTLSGDFVRLSISAGLKCEVYEQMGCEKAFNTGNGKVSNVQGYFDVRTDARASKQKVSVIGSFMCSKV